jgi:carboxypeptidase Taq
MEKALKELKHRWAVIEHLRISVSMLSWDQKTYMPAGGAAARGAQIAALTRLAHEKLTDPEVGKLIEELEKHEGSLEADSDEARMIRVGRRDFDRAIKVPPDLLAEFSQHITESYQRWTVARGKDDFQLVEADLEKTLDLSRRYAECFQPYDHIADPIIDRHDPDMTVKEIQSVFDDLRPRLVALLGQIMEKPEVDQAVVRQPFPIDQQLEMTKEVIAAIGFDFEHGRQDTSPHPFATLASSADVRITTRFNESDLTDGLYSSMHEAGHGMYEQSVAPEFGGTPLAHGASSGVHESQSRLWENIIGRSRGFWTWFFPQLKQRFSEQLADTTAEDLYRAVNPVRPSLIRVDADEVTYNLHVMIRFDLELQLLEGQLAVTDLPEAWADRYESVLGIRPPDNKDGVLQDVHWYSGTIGGAFQGYTLGNILSAQFYNAALEANPDIPQEIESGNFANLHAWLKENIYRHGRKFTMAELAERVTGQGLTIEPYMKYLQNKYGDLYSYD